MSRIQHIIIVESLAYNYGHYLFIQIFTQQMYFEGLLYAKHQEGCCGKDLKYGFGIKEFILQKRK